jgi:peptidoglycan/LPS O-acetylase OafA/YrhL
MTENKSRLVGIDLLRGISAYAIALIHSGGYAASGYWATQLGSFSKFALMVKNLTSILH